MCGNRVRSAFDTVTQLQPHREQKHMTRIHTENITRGLFLHELDRQHGRW